MRMAVMHVGNVRVVVDQRFVPVEMAMGLAGRDRVRMSVLMVRVVHVPVLVLERIVRVQMRVSFADEQAGAGRH